MKLNALRRTKIVITLGPAVESVEMLRRVIIEGADIFRSNFSHGTLQTHEERITLVRKLAAEQNKEIAILVDLQGPKIRIGRFKNKKIQLQDGQDFILDPQ